MAAVSLAARLAARLFNVSAAKGESRLRAMMLRRAAPIKAASILAVSSAMAAPGAAAAANIKSSTTRPVQKRANRQPPSLTMDGNV